MDELNDGATATADDPEHYLALDEVDLTNCDREQLHVLGTVQPHGVMLVLDEQGTVVVASANASAFLGVDELHGQALGTLVDDGVGAVPMQQMVEQATSRARLGQAVLHDGRRIDAVVHRMQGHVFVEIELSTDDDLAVLLSDVAASVAALASGASLETAGAVATAAVRRITGFDRVMIYEFHEDGHGEVVAESLRPDLEPFLGLHYPAADIPKQARLLYVRNWSRLIADVTAEASPLEPQTLPTGAPVNLAQSQLRAVSPIHLEYLRNMGVGASLSLSLVDDGELVGLIACHAMAPRRVPFAARAAAELMARLLSEQFARTRAAEAAEAERGRRRAQITVLRRVAESSTPAAALEAIGADTTTLLGADAFVGRLRGETCELGDTPPTAELVELALGSARNEALVAVDDVQSWLSAQGAEGVAGDGGLLVVALDGGDHLAWHRRAVVRTVSWGGDPNENVQPSGDRLSPRGSFDEWVETMASAGPPWTVRDRQLAESLRRTLIADTTPGEGYRVIEALTSYTEELEVANASLRRSVEQREEIVSAVAHDLRGPVRTLAALTEALVARVGDDVGLQAIGERVTGSAHKLEELLDGIQRWARLEDGLASATIDLGQTVDTVLSALRLELDEAHAEIEVREMPAVVGDPVLIRQALQNLVANAVRYRAASRPLVVRITADRDDADVVLHVEDNGIGIPVENQSEVFGMFRRVPGVDRGGTGMGLALVRRIVEAHRGAVWVDSTSGVGSTFHIRLPAATERSSA